MKKSIYTILLSLIAIAPLYSQTRLLDRSGQVKFYSEASMEKIEASTNSALGVLEPASNNVAVSILMKGFDFEKALMQEHFNENYVESDKYPKATFAGKISDTVDFSKDGKSASKVEGDLTIHGVKQHVTPDATFEVKGNTIEVTTKFMVKLADYKIKIPNVVVDNISEEVEVTAHFKFKKD